MKILAIDTSANLCAACIYNADTSQVLATESRDIGRGHAEVLMGIIETVLDRSETCYEDLQKIAVTCGPGSFAGVRVGLASAKGFQIALGIPAEAVSTLNGMVEVARENAAKGKIAALIDAQRGQAYFQLFSDSDSPFEGKPDIATYKKIAELLENGDYTMCGSGSEPVSALLKTPMPISHQLTAVPVETVARLVAAGSKIESGPEPVYVRPPDAKPQSGFVLPRA